MIIQHPNEDPYSNVVFSSRVGTPKEVLMLEIPQIEILKHDEPLVEGIVEEVNDSDFETFSDDHGSVEIENQKVTSIGVQSAESQNGVPIR